MAHKVSTVVVNTVGNLSAVNIPAGSFGVVSTGNLNAMDTLAGSLNAMDTRAGSSAAANIPAARYRRSEYGERGGYGKYRD